MAQKTRQTEQDGEGAAPTLQRLSDDERARPADDEHAPESPTDLGGRSRRAVLKRAVREFREDNLRLAALTYYSILAIFPAILALISILGLLGDSATQTLLDNMQQIAFGPAQEIFSDAIANLQSNQGAAGVLFFVGLGLALTRAR